LGLDGGPNNDWILTPDPLILDPHAGRILLGSSGTTQMPGVPKWGAGLRPAQRDPNAPFMLGCAQLLSKQPNHHVGAVVCPPLRQDPSATWALQAGT
jgi:hypothetical protein